MIDPISALAMPLVDPTSSVLTAQKPASDFSSWVAREMQDLNTKLSTADTQVRELAVGDTTNIHQVMIALEKARMSLELVVQVRNKLLEGYQSLMQMQV